MATLLDVPAAIMAIGKALSIAAGEAKESVRELREEIEATGRASAGSTTSTMAKAGDSEQAVGAHEGAGSGAASVTAGGLSMALQSLRGRGR